MKTTLVKALVGAVGALALISAACAETPAEINFGVISTEASVNQKKNWEPFVEAMSKAIGVKVRPFYATDYAGVIEAMRFNKVHVAWFGNKSAMEAVDRANGEVFARILEGSAKAAVWAIPAPGGGSRAFCDRMNSWAQGEGQPGLGYIFWSEDQGAWGGPIAKNLGADATQACLSRQTTSSCARLEIAGPQKRGSSGLQLPCKALCRQALAVAQTRPHDPRTPHADLSFPHHHSRPQHGGRAGTLARHRHEE